MKSYEIEALIHRMRQRRSLRLAMLIHNLLAELHDLRSLPIAEHQEGGLRASLLLVSERCASAANTLPPHPETKA